MTSGGDSKNSLGMMAVKLNMVVGICNAAQETLHVKKKLLWASSKESNNTYTFTSSKVALRSEFEFRVENKNGVDFIEHPVHENE